MDDLERFYSTLAHDLDVIDQMIAEYDQASQEVKKIEEQRLHIIGLIEAGDEASLEEVRNFFKREANSDDLQ